MNNRAERSWKRIRKILAGGMAAACLFSCAFAEGFTLPAGLVKVGEDAFAGIPSLREITVPATLETISGPAFSGSDETIWVHCPPGDAALRLLNQGLDVDAGTTCRALLIGQTYPESDRHLAGPANDIAAMEQMLTHLDHMDFQVTACSNLTKDGILSAICTAFGEAGNYDISLFYYSGHGNSNGSLVGCNNGIIGESISPAELRSAMDGIPGRKVLIIDACYSGAFVPDNSLTLTGRAVLKKDYATSAPPATASSGTEEQPDPGKFNTAFMNAFSSAASGRRKLSGRGAGTAFSSYYVMSACASNEESFEWPFSGISRGIFTKFLCDGIGWHSGQQGSGTKSADTNEDQLVTFGEAFTYAKNQTRLFVEEKREDATTEQNAQSNAGDLQSFSPFR